MSKLNIRAEDTPPLDATHKTYISRTSPTYLMLTREMGLSVD